MLKAKEKGDVLDQRVDNRSQLTMSTNPSQHTFGDYKYVFEHLV